MNTIPYNNVEQFNGVNDIMKQEAQYVKKNLKKENRYNVYVSVCISFL